MTFDELVDEYLESAQFRISDADDKVETALRSFASLCSNDGICPKTLSFVNFETILDKFARLDHPLETKRSLTPILRGFFAFCADSGRFPAASPWEGWVSILERRYQAEFREDGSVRGETFKKNYSDLNRNDPCPCGSGRKFKKCCMGIIT